MAVVSRKSDRRAAEAETGPTASARVPRRRVAAARGARAVGSGMLGIARVVRLIASLVVLIIAVAIVLRVAGANPHNVVVRDFHDVASTLVGPFKNVFTLKNAKESIALNWGIAAIVYLVLGHAVASVLARAAPRGRRRWARPVA